MLLDGLDDVPWSELTHAYGNATDVPALIRSLVSADDAEREHALHELFGNIWHQGTVYQATIYALPFLIDLLRDPLSPDREALALLVASIIAGRGYSEIHWSSPIVSPFTRRPLAKPSDLADRIAKERDIVQEIRKRGAAAVDILLAFLDHSEADVRMTVAQALGCLPSCADTIVPVLRTALADEHDVEVRKAMADSLNALAPEHPG
jgi:HEAT repeat protein